MATCFTRFLRDESGLVITAELIMIITIAVISLAAGWGAVASMLAEELEDVANSVGSLDQSYSYNGIVAPGHASCSGGGFNDSTNLVNVSTDSNFNASVAGLDFTPLIPNIPTPEINLAGEPFVLVEEEFEARTRWVQVFRERQCRVRVADVVAVDQYVHGPDVLFVRTRWVEGFFHKILGHDVRITQAVVDSRGCRVVVGFLVVRVE